MAASLVAFAVMAAAAGAASAAGTASSPTAGTASSPTAAGVVHTRIDRSGTVTVTGYDGGVAEASAATTQP